ncbi:ATP-binding protein [Ralstonia pseudosolanacearum]|uniref:AlbA family DNA-binding domain-containing protein n=1 Tax=Ralstonia pseudosolanacearum TaxID=1310165 RepID=UPI00200534A9|nr:ATP-binding protein [Ralstonia pseudosolanacearum]MCK4130204.1 ATP-binding protein [Ralstonia pseudosolanacearum]
MFENIRLGISMALPTRLVDTTQTDLDRLLEDKVPEGPHLDFKRDLPAAWDEKAKHRLMADVTAFANAGGGDIIYGIDEDVDARAASIIPQMVDSVDQEVRRLQDFLLNLAEPRMPGTQVYAVPVIAGGNSGHVVVIRIPESWAGPHRVKTNQQFFVRDGLRNRQLDMPEIRALFLQSENRAQRIRDFRNSRLGKVLTGEVPYKLTASTVLVLHLMPLQAVLGVVDVDPVQYLGQRRQIPIVASPSSAVTSLVNLDGAAGARNVVENGTNGYTLLFRNGFIESTWVLRSGDPAYQAVLPGGAYEDYVAQFVTAARQELTHWGLAGQAVVMLSILNAKAVTLGIQRPYAYPETGNFDRDVLAIPDVELPDESDVRVELRPLFDLVWQSAGFAGSPHYDGDGNWVPLQS